MKNTTVKNAELSNENIDDVCSLAEEYLDAAGVDRKDILRIKLAAEEVLLNYQEKFGEECHFSARCIKRFGYLRLEFTIAGEPFDPLESDDEFGGELLRGIMAGMDIAPLWRYQNGKNRIIFTPKKKVRSQAASLGMAIVAALALGALCNLLPQEARDVLSGSVVTPLFNMFLGLLTAVSGPMIFVSITCGIYSMGDTATLGKIGKRMISRFLLMSFLMALLVIAALVPFFPVEISSSGGSFDLTDIYQMILDIVPSNFFTPFTEGNPLQIIFVAVVIGLSLLILGDKTATIASLVEQLNYIVQLIMSTLGRMLPLFIFLSIFNMQVNGSFSALMSSYKLLPMLLLAHIVIMGAYTALVCIRKRVSPVVLMKKLFPTFLIGLSTASSSAALQTNLETCEKKLGIDSKLVRFGVPLGQVVFMLGACAEQLVGCMCMAEIFEVSITPSFLVTAWLVSVLLAIAAPPIPGGGLATYTIMMTQLGIPAEALAIVIAFGVVSDFPSTACCLFTVQTEMVELAGSLDMLDVETLRRAE